MKGRRETVKDRTPRIFVVGSAHLDIIASISGGDCVVDKTGSVSVDIGGTACNIASNIVSIGMQCRFMTVLNKSPYSRVITEHLTDAGVDVIVKVDPSSKLACFSAHVSQNGELYSAVSSTPCEGYAFSRPDMADAMQGCIAAIVDCNLSVDTLNLVIDVAETLGIPTVVAAVSEIKSLKLAKLAKRPYVAFMNQLEATYLRQNGFSGLSSNDDLVGLVADTVVITKSSMGVSILTANETIEAPAPIVSSYGNFLGAGDAFLASAICCHLGEQLSWVDSLTPSLHFVAKLIERTSCNISADNSVEKILEATNRSAHYDSMTKLYNRGSIQRAMETALIKRNAQKNAVSVILLDIDHFKSVNDTFGHDVGDMVIQSVAEILRDVVRGDDVAGRWGGEEFLCILPGADINDALIVAERIRARVERQINVPRQITISAGIASNFRGEKLNAIIKRADEALYVSKNDGRNRVTLSNENLSENAFVEV